MGVGHIPVKDNDRAINIMAAAPAGWSYHFQGICFETSKLNSVYNKDDKGIDLGFTSLKLYNSSDVEITTQASADTDCVKTVLDWEPTFDYRVIGGSLRMPNVTTENIYAYCIGVPDVPAASGGSKEFICCVNMKFVDGHASLDADGRAGKLMTYDATYHTNKMRLILNHNPGIKCEFMIGFEVFRQ